MCCGVYVEVREQHCGVCSLLSTSSRFLNWNSVCQTCTANTFIPWAISQPFCPKYLLFLPSFLSFFRFLFPFWKLMSISKVKSWMGTWDYVSFQRCWNRNTCPCIVISSYAIQESLHAPLSTSYVWPIRFSFSRACVKRHKLYHIKGVFL